MVYKTSNGTSEPKLWAKDPADLNYLRPHAFKFALDIIHGVSFFCQSANMPLLQLGTANFDTRLKNIPLPGEKLEYSELVIRFIIQENMENYIELYNWLVGLGSPEDVRQYQAWNEQSFKRFPNLIDKDASNYSDGVLSILDSDYNPTVNIYYKNCFPTSLQGLEFDISSGDTQYLTAQATFNFQQYKIEKL